MENEVEMGAHGVERLRIRASAPPALSMLTRPAFLSMRTQSESPDGAVVWTSASDAGAGGVAEAFDSGGGRRD